MFLIQPDPHPGRCKNFRPQRDRYGYPTNVRCLDYDNHDGRCTFPDPPEMVRHDDGAWMVYKTPQPEPWVSPLEGRDSAT